MNNTRKRKSWWVIVTGIVLALLLVWFSPLRQSAVALYNMQHSIDVFLSFYSEVLGKTPAGLYYSDLIMAHNYEQYDIIQAHFEHFDEFWHVVELFTPGIEALTDGRGDTVLITEEHINSLKKEWEWESQFASDSMREDIEKELQRFPLETFVEMTFSEAWDYVNANFPDDLVYKAPPTRFPLMCIVGTDSDCLSTPALVSDGDGRWAYYYIDNEIYFEYPSDWRLEQRPLEPNSVLLVPAPDSLEGNKFSTILLFYLDLSDQPGFQYDPLTYPQEFLQRPTPVWKRLVSLSDFTGSEFLMCQGCPNFGQLQAVFYDPDTKAHVELNMDFQAQEITNPMYGSETIQELFPNFRHIMESLRYWHPK